MTVVTPKAAAVFRAFSRNEDVLAVDRDAALLWLRRLRGFSKTEADAWLFIRDEIADHPALFATVDKDKQVLWIVEKRFRVYIDDRESKRRGEKFPVVTLDADEWKRLANNGVEKMDWKTLKKPPKKEVAQDLKEMKDDEFTQWLQRLKNRRDKESTLYLQLIETTLREDARCRLTAAGRADLALENSQLQERLARGGRIQSLTYKRSRSK